MSWKAVAVAAAIPAVASMIGAGAANASTIPTPPSQNSSNSPFPNTTSSPFQTTGPKPVLSGPSTPSTKPKPKVVSVSHVSPPTQTTASSNSAPGTMYDSAAPQNIPAGSPTIATYANGPYAASPATLSGHRVVWIDTNGSDPRANALDIEPGDANASQAAGWAQAHISSTHTPAILYSSYSTWSAVLASVSSLPKSEQSQVKYWIAQPSGTPHGIPGASAVQYLWNGNQFDASTIVGGFLNGIQVQK